MMSLDDDQLLFKGENGYIIYKTFQNECYIDYVFIDETFRERGFGTKLINDFIDNISECNMFFLEALYNKDKNEGSSLDLSKLVQFYENLGFQKEKIIYDEMVVQMRKVI